MFIAVAIYMINEWGRAAGRTWVAAIAGLAIFLLGVVEFVLHRSADDHTRESGPYSESTKITR